MKKNKTKGLFASIVLGVAVTACAPASSSGTVTEQRKYSRGKISSYKK